MNVLTLLNRAIDQNIVVFDYDERGGGFSKVLISRMKFTMLTEYKDSLDKILVNPDFFYFNKTKNRGYHISEGIFTLDNVRFLPAQMDLTKAYDAIDACLPYGTTNVLLGIGLAGNLLMGAY